MKRFYITLAVIGTAAIAWAVFLFGDAYIQYMSR